MKKAKKARNRACYTPIKELLSYQNRQFIDHCQQVFLTFLLLCAKAYTR